MATLAQIRKRIERVEAQTNTPPEVIYRLDFGRIGGNTSAPMPDLDPGQRLVTLTSIFPAHWSEIARG